MSSVCQRIIEPAIAARSNQLNLNRMSVRPHLAKRLRRSEQQHPGQPCTHPHERGTPQSLTAHGSEARTISRSTVGQRHRPALTLARFAAMHTQHILPVGATEALVPGQSSGGIRPDDLDARHLALIVENRHERHELKRHGRRDVVQHSDEWSHRHAFATRQASVGEQALERGRSSRFAVAACTPNTSSSGRPFSVGPTVWLYAGVCGSGSACTAIT